MPAIAFIRSQVERRIPGALTVYERQPPEIVATGIAAFDRESGGLPKNSLIQICAPSGVTSGRTLLLLSALAQVTGKGQFCALVDAADSFDPESAAAMGVCLSRLLWVRCKEHGMKAVEQSFKSADILIQNGGFGLIAIDLGSADEKLIRKIPLTTWFRFARVMETLPASLVVLLPCSAAQSCAALTLNMSSSVEWTSTHERAGVKASHTQLIAQVDFNLQIQRTLTKKPVQGVQNRFTARPQWA
jgi:hypothetical protein